MSSNYYRLLLAVRLSNSTKKSSLFSFNLHFLSLFTHFEQNTKPKILLLRFQIKHFGCIKLKGGFVIGLCLVPSTIPRAIRFFHLSNIKDFFLSFNSGKSYKSCSFFSLFYISPTVFCTIHSAPVYLCLRCCCGYPRSSAVCSLHIATGLGWMAGTKHQIH
jgi:hypothetical protein